MNKVSKMHLFHGGHRGTESEFGAAAEKWGVSETTLSFEEHRMERAKNVEVLDDETLRQGRVSMEFVFQTLGRRFATGKGLRRVIKSMFHVVTRSDELFAVGWIVEDDHVKGGTGWGVELAKFFNRKVHIFDQDKERWFSWIDRKWEPSDPELPSSAFSATGTRNLSAAGKEAIEDLFARSLEGEHADASAARNSA
jgi:hypothetical protein